MTLQQALTQIQQSGVLEAAITRTPSRLGDFTLYEAAITYYTVSGDIAKENTVALRIHNYNEADGSGDAYWLGGLPDVLRPAPDPPEKVATEQQVLDYVNAQLSGKTVLEPEITIGQFSAVITGYFPHVETGKRVKRTYILSRNAQNQIVYEQVVAE